MVDHDAINVTKKGFFHGPVKTSDRQQHRFEFIWLSDNQPKIGGLK